MGSKSVDGFEAGSGAAIDAETIASFRDPLTAIGDGDIVIVGAGLAGLFTALKLAPLPVTIVAAAPLGEGAASAWAQGGVAAAVGEGDTAEKHAADTIAAGAGIVDEAVANLVAGEAADRIRDLLAYGVPFDRDSAGHFVLSREAAHSENRVVRVSGDRAGAAIMATLIAAVRATPSIRILEGYEAEDLILDAGSSVNARVRGIRVVRRGPEGGGIFNLLPARAVVLATGGVGALYAVTTNPRYARGEAMAFAARAGAAIADAEFVQFHPTAIDIDADPAPLASEALRGEGAILVNSRGERFMKKLHEAAELAPRDIVARGVFAELSQGRGAFLDAREAIGARFATAFPTVYALCAKAGIDPARELIPIAPAAHYHMGGVATDVFGRTTVEALWAVGEVASTGLHGANRLASNSLLEAVVFGARVADDIKRLSAHGGTHAAANTYRIDAAPRKDETIRHQALAVRLRSVMSRNVGVVRNSANLEAALAEFRAIEAESGGEGVIANMAVAAQLIAGSALLRKESRGAHFRSDHPRAIARLAARSHVTLDDIRAIDLSPKARTKPKKLAAGLPL